MAKKSDDELPDILQPLAFWGFEPVGMAGKSLRGQCPFCLEETFHADPMTGKWVCSRMNHCGHQGNVASFLKQYWEFARELTTRDDLDALAHWRGIPRKYFERHKWAKDPNSDRYLAPVRNSRGGVVDLRNVRIGRKVISTKGVLANLLGWHALISRRGEPVYVAAGEWDGAAIEWLLDVNREPGVVVIPPGEGTMKISWAEAMRGRRVYLCYDNDKAGIEAMARIGGCDGFPKEDSTVRQGKLRSYVKDIWYIHWPKGFQNDVNDWVKKYGAREKSFRKFKKLFKNYHPRSSTKPKAEPKVEVKARAKPGTNGVHSNGKIPTFTDVVDEFKKWNFKMPQDYQDALRVSLATVLTTPLSGDAPVWTYLVGPPGSGKTALLMALSGSDQVVFRSTIGTHELVSGWSGQDPSLIPDLNGKCFILKDFTEVLKMRAVDRDDIFGTLRGAFDGKVNRSYGNGVKREYESRFSMIAGVTHAIHGQTAKGAALGERFLKYQLTDKTLDSNEKVLAAMDGLTAEEERNSAISDLTGRFVDYRSGNIKRLPLPEWFRQRMPALVSLISMLRTGVERDMRRNIYYRPEAEIGTRLAVQLTKLAWGICHTDDKKEIDPEVWKLILRVGMDTAYGFARDVVEGMMRAKAGKQVSLQELAQESDLPKATLREQLDDMLLLKLIVQRRTTLPHDRTMGAAPYLWTVKKDIRQLWNLVTREP